MLAKLLEPRVKAAVRNIEMRYLAVIRDQQDRIQVLDELLCSDDPATKLCKIELPQIANHAAIVARCAAGSCCASQSALR